MPELTWLLDQATGTLTAEGLTRHAVQALAQDLLPSGVAVNCARPVGVAPLLHAPMAPAAARVEPADAPRLRVYRLYHGALTEGPGRRSVVQVAGCTLRCPGCYVPETHDPQGGISLTVNALWAELSAPDAAPCDGVTVLGGEPFQQAAGLAALLRGLRERGQHTTVYSGYTLEQLRASPEPEVAAALSATDLLIEGPFVAALAQHAGAWRGSANQRLIPFPAVAQL